MRPSVLFVREDSLYKSLECDAWDIHRDAKRWPGGTSLVAHPPCRGWGCLKGMSHATEEEKALGPWSVDQIRKWGGVLEHPAHSKLWEAAKLPKPNGERDAWGGFSLSAPQWWWGHRAQKLTWFYIVGIKPTEVPEIHLRIGEADRVITNRSGLRHGQPGFKTEVTKRERDATPPALAIWLLEIARRAQLNRQAPAHTR